MLLLSSCTVLLSAQPLFSHLYAVLNKLDILISYVSHHHGSTMRPKLFTVIVSYILILSSATQERFILFENIAAPTGWVALERADPDHIVQFQLSVRPSNVELVEQQIANSPILHTLDCAPRRTQVQFATSSASDHDVACSIREWLRSAGMPDPSMTSDENSIQFNASIAQAETLLKTTFNYYRNPEHDIVLLRTLGYSVPERLAAHIIDVQPTTRFED